MFETTIRFKPKDRWRPGMTEEKLIEELDARVRVPGLANFWIPPIRNRIDMLATGIKSPVGIKVAGSDLAGIDRTAKRIEAVVKTVPGVASALAERLTGGRYIDVDIDPAPPQHATASMSPTCKRSSRARSAARRSARQSRGSPAIRSASATRASCATSIGELASLPVLTPSRQQITLGTVARVKVSDGPPMLRSGNGRPVTWIYVDSRGRDLQGLVQDIQRAIARDVRLPPGVSVSYTGQFEFLVRATERMKVVVPVTLAIIFLLLYLTFRRWDEALLIMATLPFALTGGLWLLYLLGYNQSVASAVGFIALAGVAAEFGVVMLIYLKHALADRSDGHILAAVREGAAPRPRRR